MSFQVFYKIESSQYGEGILLEKYGENFGIYAAQESKDPDGTVYKKWAFPQNKDKKPIDKSIPMGVKLGNQNEAIETLKYFLEQLNVPEEEIPF